MLTDEGLCNLKSQLDRRATLRVPMQVTVMYPYLLQTTRETKTIDVGLRGAALESVDPFPQGVALPFILIYNDLVILCMGKVLYQSPVNDSLYRTGIKFIDATGRIEQAVNRLLESQRSANGVISRRTNAK